MLIEPNALLREAGVLEAKGVRNPLSLISIDPFCLIITPFHQLANQLRETLRGENRHGSCGLGVGEAREDSFNGISIMAHEAACNGAALLGHIKRYKLSQFEEHRSHPIYQTMEAVEVVPLAKFYREFFRQVRIDSSSSVMSREAVVIMEGAQGVLLDEHHGFAPYNTWTRTTFENAEGLLDEVGIRERERVGVVRSYATRHGAGPFPTEDGSLNVPELHNGTHPWMGAFRVGHFDAMLLAYALKACGTVDSLAITHLDRRPSDLVAIRYGNFDCAHWDATGLAAAIPEYSRVENLPEWLANRTGAPVRYESRGPKYEDKVASSSRHLWNKA